VRSWSTFCKVCMWVVLVICTFFQALVLLGIGQSNSAAVAAGQPDAVYNLWPIAVMTAALWAAVLLFIFLKKAPAVGLALALAAGVLTVIVAMDLMNTFTVHISSTGEDVGLSTAKVVYRHLSPLLIPLLMLPAFFLDMAARKQEKARLEAEGGPRFDLSGAPLFRDGESTLGISYEDLSAGDALAGEAHREKRSRRVARRKEQA